MSYWKWAWGLVPLAALTAFAIAVGTPAVERDLEARLASALGASGARATAQGRDIILSAQNASGPAAADLVRIVEATAGVRDVRLEPQAPGSPRPAVEPAPEPLRFEIERRDEGMVVSGSAPDAATRDALLAALRTAAAPGALVGDLALGASPPPGLDFEVAARFAAVQAARLAIGRVYVEGDQLAIVGKVADSGALKALLDAVRPPLPGGLRLGVVSVQALPPAMKPFVFSAERTAQGLVLSGGAPSGEARALLLDMAREIAGSGVTDRIALVSGAHEDFPSFAAFGLMSLSRLATGRFTLTDASFALEGEAVDADAFEALAKGLRAAPMGLSAAHVNVRPPRPVESPFIWTAMRDGDALVVRGAVPDEAVAAGLLEVARGFFPGATVRNDMRAARGAPEGFASAASAAVESLSRLRAGRAELRDLALTLAGELGQDVTLEALRGGLRLASLRAYSLDVSGVFERPTAPSAALPAPAPDARAQAAPVPNPCDDAARRAPLLVHFATGHRRPRKAPTEALRDIAMALRACPEIVVEVSGHTDVAGSRRANLRLSQARARDMERRLRAAGAPPERILVRSYAYDRPVAKPVWAASARAQNRRVEVVLGVRR